MLGGVPDLFEDEAPPVSGVCSFLLASGSEVEEGRVVEQVLQVLFLDQARHVQVL